MQKRKTTLISQLYRMRTPLFMTFVIAAVVGCGQTAQQSIPAVADETVTTSAQLEDSTYVWDGKRIEKPDSVWQKELNGMQYYVARQAGTERPFQNAYFDNHEKGVYYCVACGLPLFSSSTKFESGTGWPSFYAPINEKNIGKDTDLDIGYPRTEIHCARCDSHLGHLFDDAPQTPTGLRYCMNSASLIFKKE